MNRRGKIFGIILTTIIIQSCEDKPVIPSLTTALATEISTTSAVSGGTVTDDGGAQIVSGGVCWNTSEDPTTENSRTIEGGDLSSFTSNITQLLPNTVYYLRAYATNSAGTGYGNPVSFKTLGNKPSFTSLNVTNITVNSVTFNSSVNANLLSTTVTFEYGLTASYGNTAAVPQNPVTGNTDVIVTADLTGLTPGTSYHFRIKTENSLGITYSSDMTFTTLGKIPDVTEATATNLEVRAATISGSVNPNFLTTAVTVEWGTTTSYGNTITPSQSPANGSTAVIVSAVLTGLTPGKTYHYRIKATNELGTTNSEDKTFTTLGQVPTVNTLDATDISASTATLNGTVNPNYLPTTVSIEWGIDYGYGNLISPSQNSLNGSTTVNLGAGLTGLSEGTKYCYRITATNELGTTNGIGFTFTTFAKPQITTKDISEITTNSAISGGSIISDFGSSIIERGICWSTLQNPTISDNKVLSSLDGANFSVPITSLTPNTTYYLRAYATNGVGTGYGDELILRTYTGTVSDIEGNQYYTVTIGSQIWMAQNLKTTKYQNGASIETTTPAQQDISGESSPKYQWAPGGSDNNVSAYGRLYTWHAVTDSRNICPLTWHVASDSEWATMVNFLGGVSVAGGKLKEAGLVHFASPNTGATNESGFTCLPAGYRNVYGLFAGITDNGQFWTNTEYDATDAWLRIIWSGSTYASPSHTVKSWGSSVRCIKD